MGGVVALSVDFFYLPCNSLLMIFKLIKNKFFQCNEVIILISGS